MDDSVKSPIVLQAVSRASTTWSIFLPWATKMNNGEEYSAVCLRFVVIAIFLLSLFFWPRQRPSKAPTGHKAVLEVVVSVEEGNRKLETLPEEETVEEISKVEGKAPNDEWEIV